MTSAHRRHKGIFVTGADTGVGKTLIAAGLVLSLKAKGIDVGVMKPLETGCRSEGGSRIAQDALFLRQMSGCTDEMSLVNPYSLAEPLAPAVAAAREGVDVRIETIRKAFETLASRHEVVIVEGAGGLLVPVTPGYFMADLARELELPIVIVARASLGTINHCLLSLSYARSQGIDVLGVVMSRTTQDGGVAEQTNAAVLKGLLDCPFLGEVPFLPVVTKDAILAAFARSVDLAPLWGCKRPGRGRPPCLPNMGKADEAR